MQMKHWILSLFNFPIHTRTVSIIQWLSCTLFIDNSHIHANIQRIFKIWISIHTKLARILVTSINLKNLQFYLKVCITKCWLNPNNPLGLKFLLYFYSDCPIWITPWRSLSILFQTAPPQSCTRIPTMKRLACMDSRFHIYFPLVAKW